MSSSAPRHPATVLVVEDIKELRDIYRGFIESDPELAWAGEARTGLEAAKIYPKILPDVVSMNINMPDLDGISATAFICRQGEGARVVMVSVCDDYPYRLAAMYAGAEQFLPKPVERDPYVTMLKRVAACHRRKPLFPEVDFNYAEALGLTASNPHLLDDLLQDDVPLGSDAPQVPRPALVQGVPSQAAGGGMTSTIHLWCRNCGIQFKCEVHDVIDLRQHAGEEANALARRLNTHACPACGTEHFIDQPVLYINHDLGFSVQ